MAPMRLPMTLLAAAMLAVVPVAASANGGPARPGFDLDAATIPDLQQRMANGHLTAVQLTAAYLHRITTIDGKVRSVLAVNPHALAEAAPPPTDPTYQQRRGTATDSARRSIDETLARFDLDAIMAPTNSPAWKTDYATGDAFVLGSSTPAAVAGYPHVSVPAGYAGPLPIGVSFFAERWSDAKVLAMAAAFERANPAYRPPAFLPTIG